MHGILENLLKHTGMKQREFAGEMETSPSQLNRWIGGSGRGAGSRASVNIIARHIRIFRKKNSDVWSRFVANTPIDAMFPEGRGAFYDLNCEPYGKGSQWIVSREPAEMRSEVVRQVVMKEILGKEILPGVPTITYFVPTGIVSRLQRAHRVMRHESGLDEATWNERVKCVVVPEQAAAMATTIFHPGTPEQLGHVERVAAGNDIVTMPLTNAETHVIVDMFQHIYLFLLGGQKEVQDNYHWEGFEYQTVTL